MAYCPAAYMHSSVEQVEWMSQLYIAVATSCKFNWKKHDFYFDMTLQHTYDVVMHAHYHAYAGWIRNYVTRHIKKQIIYNHMHDHESLLSSTLIIN